MWRNLSDRKIERLDTAYWKSAGVNKSKDTTNWRGDEIIYNDLITTKTYVKKHNVIFLNTIFLQTILTFIFQLIGFKRTSLKTMYKGTSIVFGIMLIINLWLAVLMEIVPTGPFV